jgi:hypothetical protein
MVVMFDRYRLLAWVGDSPYTVALIRDPDRGRARYLTCDRGAAAMYKNANVLTLVLEQATTNGLTVDGSEKVRPPLKINDCQRPPSRRPLPRPAKQTSRRT